MTKLWPSKTWWTGGGWCTRPVIGSKSATLNVYGYRQPSQPTTSNGCVGQVTMLPTSPDGPWPRCMVYTSTSRPSVMNGSRGAVRSRSQYGACSRNCPYLDMYRFGGAMCEFASMQ